MSAQRPPAGRLRVLETCLYAEDLDAALVFYQEVLGLEVTSRVAERHVFFRCGEAMLLVFDPRRTREPTGEVPPHGATGPGHVAFAVAPEELGSWRSRLQSAGVPVEAEVVWPGGGRSIYLRDPAGNSVELANPTIWTLE